MNIQFCGAAGAVTGSSHLITLDDGYKILLDCGLYQGDDKDFENFNRHWYFEPSDIDCVIVSHAHIDHTGRLPKLVKDGFAGEIICTHATRDLAALMLMDSAKIQERDAEYMNKEQGRWEYGEFKPLYTTDDIMPCVNAMVGIGYEHWHPIDEHIDVFFRDTGHILGSASVVLKIKKQNGEKDIMLGFSGDIGRPNRPILRDPIPMMPCDYLICESTYASKKHESKPDEENHFLKVIEETCVKKKGKLLIPTFSVGRTQEIVYMLDVLETYGKLPRIPVYVDSPLAVNATQVFQSHPECFDAETLEYMLFDENPFGFNSLKYVRHVKQSKQINRLQDACIIISSSGMANAGRIKHHINNNIENPNTTILIVGYCAEGTLGYCLRNGDKTVKIFGQDKQVNANVEVMSSFSAHADQDEIMDFLSEQDKTQLKGIFLVHGIPKRQVVLQEALHNDGFQKVHIPTLGEVVEL